MKNNKVRLGERAVGGFFLDNSDQEAFFEEVTLTQVLAQSSHANPLLETPFRL